MADAPPPVAPPPVTAAQLAERLFGSLLGVVDVMAVHLGDRLGWYRNLVDEGPATAPELAARTETHPRYAREWLEQQAVTGYLTLDRDGEPDERVFSIPPATAEVMTDAASLNHLAPFARMFAATGPMLPHLLEAYRTGGGVSWEQLGDDARESQADGNRPWYDARLATALAGVPDLHQSLARPGARILDVGAGGGWSTIALARAYPDADVTALDIDLPSVGMARANAADAGVAIEVHHGDAADLDAASYDVAFAFECIHDLAQPVEVLESVRRVLAPGGCLVVMDEAVAETFAPDGDELERIMYGFSLLICLPDGMSRQPSAGTGTVMRPSVLRGYGQAAGFDRMEILPIEDFGFWRFYRLT